MASKIAVCHSGRQHSHQLAEALHKHGMLSVYWTGVPPRTGLVWWLPECVQKNQYLNCNFSVPLDKIRCFPLAPTINRITRIARLGGNAAYMQMWADNCFDRYVAVRLFNTESDAVVAYENSALHIFQAARKKNKRTILDAASFHHRFQDRHSQYSEPKKLHRQIIERKNKEIETADLILTLSGLARQSYLDAGVPASKVVIVPIGADIDKFTPRDHLLPPEPFNFIFVGMIGRRKGVDILLSAFSRILKRYPFARLKIVGRGDITPFIKIPSDKLAITVVGQKTQDELVREYCGAHCFVLPSRHDSFGMVVAEAMACGLPAIVSNNVGAKEMIVDGQNGWVFNLEKHEELYVRMCDLIDRRDQLKEIGLYARQAAERYSWVNYQRNVVTVIKSSLAL